MGESDGTACVGEAPSTKTGKLGLARLIDYDADPFEAELYELAADPRVLLIDRAQRCRADSTCGVYDG